MSTPREETRVLLVCDFMLRYTAMLAAGIARSGARVVLLSRDHDMEFGGRPGAARQFVAEATAGARVTHVALPGRVRSVRGWRRTLRLRRELADFDPHVVHFQATVVNDLRLVIAAGPRSRRYAVTFHDPSPHPGDRAARKDWVLDRLLARGAGLLFVHGAVLRDELCQAMRPKAPIVVVPHGVDPPRQAPLPEAPAVLFFGRISHYKGLDVLLDAMERIWAAVPEAKLRIAGAGEVDAHPALADPRVELQEGHIPESELADLFAAANCVALPYRQASQSGVGSLAKAYGRAMVVSNTGGLPELVADGSGLLVPPEDPEALADAIVSLLTDPGLAASVGAAGLSTAESGASWDDVGALTLAAYRAYLKVPA